jgi:hypothetical protein
MLNTNPVFWSSGYLSKKKDLKLLAMKTPLSDWGEISPKEVNTNVFALMTGEINGDSFISPHSATFGGIHLNQDYIKEYDLIIPKLVHFLPSKFEVKKLSVLLPSSHLYESVGLEINSIFPAYLKKNVFIDRNFVIKLKIWSESDLSKGNRKKLRQSREGGIFSSQLDSSEIPNAYSIIEENRKRLGVIPSISLNELLDLVVSFPKLYKVFGTYYKSELIAAAIVVETHPENNYVYMWAEKLEYRNFSPVVSIFKKIVEYSQDNGYKFLDLGTSSSKGKTIEGLVRFKSNLGAMEYEKLMVSTNL